MGRKCAVYGCQSGYDYSTSGKRRIFRFGKNKAEWLRALPNMPGSIAVTDNNGVCEVHWPPGRINHYKFRTNWITFVCFGEFHATFVRSFITNTLGVTVKWKSATGRSGRLSYFCLRNLTCRHLPGTKYFLQRYTACALLPAHPRVSRPTAVSSLFNATPTKTAASNQLSSGATSVRKTIPWWTPWWFSSAMVATRKLRTRTAVVSTASTCAIWRRCRRLPMPQSLRPLMFHLLRRNRRCAAVLVCVHRRTFSIRVNDVLADVIYRHYST